MTKLTATTSRGLYMYAPVKVRRHDRIFCTSVPSTMKRSLLAFVLAIALGLPVGWLIAMLLTPILWRLEPVLHIELAGHSGPADWIFYVVWGLAISGLFLI